MEGRFTPASEAAILYTDWQYAVFSLHVALLDFIKC
jgi:hypothetical protein